MCVMNTGTCLDCLIQHFTLEVSFSLPFSGGLQASFLTFCKQPAAAVGLHCPSGMTQYFAELFTTACVNGASVVTKSVRFQTFV